MSQKNVELLLGKILTDDEFRNTFLPVGPASFALASRFGLEFTATERAALATLQTRAFESLARDLDARILRSCLGSGLNIRRRVQYRNLADRRRRNSGLTP